MLRFRKRVVDHFAAAWNLEEQAHTDFRVRDKEGAWRWTETTMRPFRAEGGESRVLALTRDVSEGHRVLDELIASEERYSGSCFV